MEMDAEYTEPLMESDAEEDMDDMPDYPTASIVKNECIGLRGWHRKYAPLEIVVFLFVFASAISLPAVQFYSIDYIDGQHSNHGNTTDVSTVCELNNSSNRSGSFVKENAAEKEKAWWFMNFSLVTSFCAIVPTLFCGSLSDSFGRKPFLAILLAAGVLQYLSWICVMYFKLSVGYFMIGYAIEGISGSYALAFMTLMSVVADVTVPGKQRAFRMFVADVTAAVGFGVAGVIGGYWIKDKTNYMYPIIVSVATNSVALLYLLILIPETVHKPTGQEQPAQFKTRLNFLKVYMDKSDPNRRRVLIVCLLCILLTAMYFRAPVVLYLQNTPFCWGSLGITLFTGIAIFVQVLASMPCVKIMQSFLKYDEVIIAAIGCISALLSNTAVGFAGYMAWLIYLSIPLGCLQYVTIPMIRSIMSTQVSKNDQGALFAGVACTETVTGVVATIVCNGVYTLTLSVYDGLIFFILAGSEILVMVLLLMIVRRVRKRKTVTFTQIQ